MRKIITSRRRNGPTATPSSYPRGRTVSSASRSPSQAAAAAVRAEGDRVCRRTARLRHTTWDEEMLRHTRGAPVAARSVGVRPAPVRRGPALQVHGGNRTAAAPAIISVGDVLDLQRSAGNQAVLSLVAAQRAEATDEFNPMDLNHRLLIAIDKKRINVARMKRHVDFDAVVAALGNLTAEQVRAVEV